MFLGIDLGTSGVKAIIINVEGQILAEASSPLSVNRPQALWSEQNPEDWVEATHQVVAQLRKTLGCLNDVEGIGLSGQMHGATLLDQNNQPIRPAILWNDGRSMAQCHALEAKTPTLSAISGNLAMPGFTSPKLAWIKDNEPENFKKVHKVLLPKDYLRLILTGDCASDMSDSAGTLWLDVAKRQWSDTLLESTDLEKAHMPDLFEGTEATGTLNEAIAKHWGMRCVPVAAGGGDNAAGAVGVGVTKPGEALLSLGTSGVYFVACEGYAPNPQKAVHTFCHAIPNTWHQMSVILSATSCLEWLCQLTHGESVGALLDELENADLALDHDTQLLFLPYLSGERTPHNNPYATGQFLGLTHATQRHNLTHAVLEGIAFAFADGQAALEESGTKIDSVSVIGGGSRSQRLVQILANALNKTLELREGGNVGPALGAARLGQLAYLGTQATLTDHDIDKVCQQPPLKTRVQPQTTFNRYYQEKLKRFQKLYQQTQSTEKNVVSDH